MGVDAGVPCRSGKIFVLSVRNVLSGPVVTVLLGQSEIDEEEFVAVTTDAHEEVVGLDVSVDEILVVNVFDSADHL